MRSRRPAPDQVADVARRRLELLSAELAEIRPEGPRPSAPGDRDGSGELPDWPEQEPAGGRGTLDGRAGPPARSRPPEVVGRHAHRSLGLRADAARWVEDRLPAALQGRVRLSAGHLAVVALTVAAGLALTVWWVTRADGDVTTVSGAPSVAVPAAGGDPLTGTASGTASSGSAVPSSAASSAPTGSAAASEGAGGLIPVPGLVGASAAAQSTVQSTDQSTAGSVGSIVVDVTGKVRRPGIATLPTGSRVVDAIEAAGGAKRGVGLGALNLARVLSDGEQVVVGLPAPAGVAASAASAPTSGAAVPMVNVNTATESQLEELPGVGPVTAAAILDYRTENGPFGSVDALLEVSGIGDATLAKIAPYVTL